MAIEFKTYSVTVDMNKAISLTKEQEEEIFRAVKRSDENLRKKMREIAFKEAEAFRKAHRNI